MQKAAVIIPTIGAKKTKKPVSPEEQAQLWGKMIRQVIASSQASVRRAGFEPVIIVVDNTKQGLSQKQKRELNTAKGTQVIFAADAGPYESFRIGGREAIQQGAKAVMICLDDFVTEAHHLDKMLKPLREKKADFVFCRWTEQGLRSFPRPQVLNETTISYLTTLANPNLKMRTDARESLPAVIQRARQNGMDLQVFTGLYAFDSQAFRRANAYLKEYYGSAKPSIWGTEPLLALAALKTGARVAGAQVPRRYEHFFPFNTTGKKAFFAGRLSQFKSGAAEIRGFLEKTGQTEKIPLLDQVVKQTTRRLSPSSSQGLSMHWKPGSKSRLSRLQQLRKRQQPGRK